MAFLSGLFKASEHPIGKTLPVGQYKVTVVKLLAEGGYGYVYLAKDARDDRISYALKKLMVRPEVFQIVQQEIDIMRSCRHKNIVSLLETSSVTIPNSNEHEMFILMEFCAGGHVGEMLQQRSLSETEVLRIFSDVCEAVAQLHAHEPPIAHRDLKVENVLIHESGQYKLCDFGSCRSKPMKVSTKTEMMQAEDEIQKFTTMAYRAPEMIDLYSGRPINERVDIWALGCLLYKLCYRVTPFEDGESALQILNVNYTIPNAAFPERLVRLIGKCLQADPALRPDIWSLIKKVCKLRNLPPTIERPRSRPKQPKPQVNPQASLPQQQVQQQMPGMPVNGMQQQQQQQQFLQKPTNYRHRRNKSNTDEIMPHQQSPYAGAPVSYGQQPASPFLVVPAPPPGMGPGLAPTVLFPDVLQDLTASSTAIITSQALQPLITQAWADSSAAKIFDSASKRPVAGDAIVCLKALICLHVVLLEGPPACVNDGVRHISLFNNLHTYWRNQKDNNPYAAAAICQYCKTLVKKMQFHQLHPEFEGNYSLDRYFAAADARGIILPVGDGHPISKETVTQMYDILANVISFFGLLGDLNGLAGSPMNSWVLACVIPLVQEAYSIFLTATFCNWKLIFVEQQSVFTAMVTNYSNVFSTLQSLWATFQRVPLITQLVPLPPLPAAPPAFDRNAPIAPCQPAHSAPARAPAAVPQFAPVAAPAAAPSFNPYAAGAQNDPFNAALAKPPSPHPPQPQLQPQAQPVLLVPRSASDAADELHRARATDDSSHKRSASYTPIVINLPASQQKPIAASTSQPSVLAPPSSPQKTRAPASPLVVRVPAPTAAPGSASQPAKQGSHRRSQSVDPRAAAAVDPGSSKAPTLSGSGQNWQYKP